MMVWKKEDLCEEMTSSKLYLSILSILKERMEEWNDFEITMDQWEYWKMYFDMSDLVEVLWIICKTYWYTYTNVYFVWTKIKSFIFIKLHDFVKKDYGRIRRRKRRTRITLSSLPN